MVANISLIMLGNAFRFLPKSYLFIPQRAFWTATLQNRRAVNQILGNWTWAIASTANYFFIFWMLVVEDGYHFEGNSITAVEWFYKPGLFLAGLLIVPVFRLMIKNINLFQRQERE